MGYGYGYGPLGIVVDPGSDVVGGAVVPVVVGAEDSGALVVPCAGELVEPSSGSGPRFRAGPGPRFNDVGEAVPIPMLGIGYVVVVTLCPDAVLIAGLG